MAGVFWSRRFERAKSDTGWFSLKTDVFPPIAAAVLVYVLAHRDKDFSLTIFAIPLFAGLATLVVAHGLHFGWNAWRAGDRLALEDARSTIADLHRQQERVEASIPKKSTDEEIIASFSERTIQLLNSWGAELARGNVGSNMFDDFVVTELQEHGLITIVYVQPGPKALANYAVPRLNLTADGSRILRKVRQAQQVNPVL